MKAKYRNEGGGTKNVSSSHGVSLWKFSGFFSLMLVIVL